MVRGNMRSMVGVATFALVIAASACGSDAQHAQPKPTSTTVAPSTTAIRGTATLDGEPFDARWIGAQVIDDSLVTACQQELPPIERGRFSLPVFKSSASAGCGRDGTEVLLWTFANDKTLYATRTLPWPTKASTPVTVDFSSARPLGAGTELRSYQGIVRNADGTFAPLGTKVEAFVGSTLCGIAQVRFTGEDDGYIMSVVGPDAKPGCVKDGAVTFRVDGKAVTTSRDPSTDSNDALDLRVR